MTDFISTSSHRLLHRHIHLSLSLQALPSVEVQLIGRGALKLRSFIVVKRFLVAHATALRFGCFNYVCLIGLVGAKGVAAEFGVGPAGADETIAIAPVFGEVVEEAACGVLACCHPLETMAGVWRCTDHVIPSQSPFPVSPSTTYAHLSLSSQSL